MGAEKTLSSVVWREDVEVEVVSLARSQEFEREMGWEVGVGLVWRFWSFGGGGVLFEVLMWMWMGGSWGEWFFEAVGLCLPMGGGSIWSESRLLLYISGCAWPVLRAWLLLRLWVLLCTLWRPDFFG
jgi:hypothetical protein